MYKRKYWLYYWLDDLRPSPDPNRYVHFKTAGDLICQLDKFIRQDMSPIRLHLDHDLNMGDVGVTDCGTSSPPGTGMDVLAYLENRAKANQDFVSPDIKIHSTRADKIDEMKARAKKLMDK